MVIHLTIQSRLRETAKLSMVTGKAAEIHNTTTAQHNPAISLSWSMVRKKNHKIPHFVFATALVKDKAHM